MPYFLKDNCVYKGTKEDPGEKVKCHEDHAAAVAHLRALYANVEDAEKIWVDVDGEWVVLEKGGPGSGWHNPPEGTHTAENAPNFAGGPGADREYGTESDEPPKGSKRCKCSKCGAVIVLPKGKQCEDIKCPSCGGGATQEKPREDKPAEGESGRNPKPGREKAAEEEPCPTCEEAKQETHTCTCPECGKSVHVPMGQKCSEVKCPGCSEMMEQGTSGEEKAMDAPGPTIHGEGGAIGEVASVMDDGGSDSRCKCPKCGKSIPCTAKACPYCKETVEPERGDADEKRNPPGEDKSVFTSYKSADGSWRWLSLSNWSVIDKERELLTEASYRDAIAYAEKTGQWGELDEIHVDGTDVGDADMLFLLKCEDGTHKIGAGGTWRDTEKAALARRAIQADPDYWGVSIKFRYNPRRKVRGVYTGDIQILKHSILPQEMAASYGTAIAVQGGEAMSKQIDEKTAEALQKLGHTPEEIDELAEKAKALPQEENVAEKEDTTDAVEERMTLFEKLGEMLGVTKAKEEPVEKTPAASEPEEARKMEEETPATTDEPAAEKETATDLEPEGMLQALGETIAKAIGAQVKEQLEQRDKRIAELETQLTALTGTLEEKVEQRLNDLPPVVKVAASSVAQTAVEEPIKGLTFGQAPEPEGQWAKSLVSDIVNLIEDKAAKFQA